MVVKGALECFYMVVEGALECFYIVVEGALECFYIVVEGALECFVAAEGAAAVRQGRYGPGATFGKLALLYSCPCKASVIARTECVLHATEPRGLSRVRAPKVLASAHAL